MRTNLELITMYKEEKDLIIGTVDVRTGLEPFPTFKEWKQEYIADYMATHKVVDIKEADKYFDKVVEEAEDVLDMSDVKDADAPKAKKQKATVTPITKAKKSVTKSTKGTGVKRKVNKAAEARSYFESVIDELKAGTMKRKNVIAHFVDQLGLTSSGASTYFQKFRKEFSM